MNNNCEKQCKHKDGCSLGPFRTVNCHNSDNELDHDFGSSSGPLMGYTTEEICNMQGRKGDLNK